MTGPNQPLSPAVGLVESVCPTSDQWDERGGLLVEGGSRILRKISLPDKKRVKRERQGQGGVGYFVRCYVML